jgi:ERF superfamily
MSDTKQVSAALVKAQRAFGPALKDKTNPAFRSKYADLGACLDAVMDALNDNGIALMQRMHPHDGGVCVETIFVHESGEQLSAGSLSVPATKQDAQWYGSAMTYARRYSVMAACGIAPEDDDGNAATKKPEVKPPVKAPPPATPAPFVVEHWLESLGQCHTAEELLDFKNRGLASAAAAKNQTGWTAIRTEANRLAALAGWNKAAKAGQMPERMSPAEYPLGGLPE